ncbi:MAG: amino acid permease, partial [Acidobacteriia bacterium]|nr:amino acid permease [Terriglobia bacterium]
EIGLTDLVLWNIATVVGLRWVAAAAHTGLGSVTLWVSAGLLFFVPSALVVSGLSRKCPAEGGLYVWTSQAFGPWHGFLCGSCYVLSTLFYIPTLLLSGLTMAAAAFGFAENKWVIVALSLGIVWLVLCLNLVGLAIGKWASDLGGAATVIVSGLLMIAGAAAWLRGGPATAAGDLLPQWNWEKVNFWSQIALAFTGLELGAIMAGEIREPEKTIPRAAWISGAAISAFYVGGTLAMLALIPAERVDFMAGLVQAGQVAGTRFGWPGLPTVIGSLIMVSAAGGFSSWLSGCARLPFVIGVDKYLPSAFGRLHPRWGTPYVALVTEGLVSTLFLVVMTAGESLRAGYQLLVDLTTATTLFPFVYLFAAAWRSGYRVSAVCGLLVSTLAILIAFVPPEGASWTYEIKLSGGCLAVVMAARFSYRHALYRRKF